MALFKIKKGLKANLPKTYNEGYCYFTTDDGKMYIDTTDASSGRVCLNAAKADALTVTNKGSATNPVYFVNGVPTECGFTVQSNVPSNAKFTDTTYSAATSSTAGLMSAADKAKLDGIASGATKIIVDNILSETSTNPVQNKIIYDAIENKSNIDHIHDNYITLPKTVSGDVITLNDSSEAAIGNLKVYGKTTQKTTTGKNLLKNVGTSSTNNGVTFTVNDDGCVTAKGTSTGRATIFLGKTTCPAGEYVFSQGLVGNANGAVAYLKYMRGDTAVYVDLVNVTEKRFTLTEMTNVECTCEVRTAGATVNNIVFKPMIRLASIADDTYEPYTGGIPSPNPDYPQPLESVGDSGSVSVTVCGKNLIDVNNFPERTSMGVTFTNIPDSGGIHAKGTSIGYGNTTTPIKLPKGRYAVGGINSSREKCFCYVRKFYADSSTKVIYHNEILEIDGTEARIEYIVQVNPNITVDTIVYPMLEAGKTVTEYELYKEAQTLTVSTPNGLPGIPVSSGGNYTDENGQQWICDEVDFAKGVYVQRVKEVTATELQNGAYNSSIAMYLVSLSNGAKLSNSENIAYCTHYPYGAYANADMPDKHFKIHYAAGNDTTNVYFKDTSFSTTEDWKAMLSTNGVKVLYQLKSHVETALTTEELAQYAALHTNYPNTTIFNDGGAWMEVTYSDKNGIPTAGDSFGLVKSGGDVTISNGIITVDNASTATKAIQDANGNVITSTYETKTNAAAKLTEAKFYTDTKVAGLVNSAPETLNTLNELAAALGDDENFATTVATNIGKKADKAIKISAGTGLTGGGTLEADRTLSLATVSGLTAGTYGPSANASGSGASITIPQFAIDTYGRVTAASSKTYTGPTIDSAMNSASTNPVQNKVIKAYVDGKIPNMSSFLPKSAGEAHKLTGALGLTENVMYGTELPATGFEGQLFFLEDDNPGLPLGGETGHVLIKNSAIDGDASWKELVALPKGGSAGQVLVKNTTADGDASWAQADYLPLTGGTIRGGDIQLGTIDSSSDDSGDLVYKYGNGLEKCRIWTQNEMTIYRGPEYRVYSKDGTALGSGHLWASGESITGAVWNDYAECRESDCEEFGYVLMENGDDTLSKTTERLSHFAGISSDTWGFSQGETDKAKTPIAVAGRVLAYPYQDRNNYKPGDCVCAAPGGTVDIMTREEVINWPDRIVGTVSCVPDYEEWGGGKNADRPSVKVNNRIWIKVK